MFCHAMMIVGALNRRIGDIYTERQEIVSTRNSSNLTYHYLAGLGEKKKMVGPVTMRTIVKAMMIISKKRYFFN